jgi:hypothetical protein
MPVHILGIRHHGPGSAKNVKQRLAELQADCILVEGPPDANEMLQWVGNKALKPPVALLVYNPDQPQQASFYPFATFSPEWQAISYAVAQNIPVRFMDLPFAHKDFANADTSVEENPTETTTPTAPQYNTERWNMDHLAEAAGFSDGEAWWEHTFEYRQDNIGAFEAIMEAFSALRTADFTKVEDEKTQIPTVSNQEEALREAYMRRIIRQAEKDGFQNIVVVCGAWHAPALRAPIAPKADDELLKKLPKTKTAATWIPWTYSRLAFESGYGAGVNSPGWYEHIWKYPKDNGSRWLANVAQTLRKDRMDISVAHLIEAQRLSNSLAAMRAVPRIGLQELNEAIVSVIGMGDDMVLKLVRQKMIVGEVMGEVPIDAPKIPLQMELEAQQKRLKMMPIATRDELVLDLRKPLDLERSVFLHRLQIIGIDWGRKTYTRTKGTFKESWVLEWTPEMMINIIEKGIWGNTLALAATNFAVSTAHDCDLATLTALLEKIIPAQLPQLLEKLMLQVENLSATTSDVLTLMTALPPLANISRYGDVRKTDTELIQKVVDLLAIRICIGLPTVCYSLNEDAAGTVSESIIKVHQSIVLLQQADLTEQWQTMLLKIMDTPLANPMVAGTNCRLLLDSKFLDNEHAEQYFSVALSVANEADQTAQWLEGFLKGSGAILLIDDKLWNLVDNWVDTLSVDHFVAVLPLLRRTFSTFTAPERQNIGMRAKQGIQKISKHQSQINTGLDDIRGALALNVIDELLGLEI